MQAHYPRNNASSPMNMTTPHAVNPPHASLDAATVGEIIQMALMRTHLAPGSYRAWRKRVRQFGERRENYK